MSTTTIRPCTTDDRPSILTIVNAAAEAYRGVIPDDCWHAPYMSAPALAHEIASGVTFWGCEVDGRLAGVMGLQHVRDVDLIRHAYVEPSMQGHGVGSALLAYLRQVATRRILVGTWAAAGWAIRFYQRHGFALVPAAEQAALLREYWTITDRQVETSVVLASLRNAADAA